VKRAGEFVQPVGGGVRMSASAGSDVVERNPLCVNREAENQPRRTKPKLWAATRSARDG